MFYIPLPPPVYLMVCAYALGVAYGTGFTLQATLFATIPNAF